MPRLAVRVTKDALRQIRGGHPWVYDKSITSIADGGRSGDLAVVFDDRRRFAAIGLYDQGSPIKVRILHHGKPATIDQAWLSERFTAALNRRQGLVASEGLNRTNAFRLIHGENDGLSGLVVDIYDTTAVVKLYSEAWQPWLDSILGALASTTSVSRVVLRASRRVADTTGIADGTILVGPELDGPVEFVENGLRFAADLAHGHKTGHFLDQRENRLLIRSHSAGRRVLDVFCCTGGFALNALAGGARTALAADRSGAALRLARASAEMQGQGDGLSVDQGEVFACIDAYAADKRKFDLVIADPPAFVRSKKDLAVGLRGYRKLARGSAALVGEQGFLAIACCSHNVGIDQFGREVWAGIKAAGRGGRLLHSTGAGPDHPVHPALPETAYLKFLVYALD